MAIYINNHQEARKVIKAAMDHLTENQSLMSAYEVKERLNEIKGLKDQWRGKIEAGALDDFQTMVNRYLLAKAEQSRSRNLEVKRWDPAKVKAVADMTRDRIKTDMARANSWDGIGEVVKTLLADAENGDLDTQRGVYEGLRGAVDLVPGDRRREANMMAVQADRKLKDLRITDQMREADAAVEEARQNVHAQYHDLHAAAESLGEKLFGPWGGSPNLEVGAYKALTKADPELASEFFDISNGVKDFTPPSPEFNRAIKTPGGKID